MREPSCLRHWLLRVSSSSHAAITVSLLAISLIGCAEDRTETNSRHRQVKISVDRPSPNVDITSYVLVTDDITRDRSNAEVIMRLKEDFPLAMQTKDRALFDRILSRNFTFGGSDEFWEREDYIRNRVERPETVESARYENLVLQFFGDVAVLTYRNAVRVRDAGDKAETFYMSWADVYVKEGSDWKIGAVHLIEQK
jgi:hypothetical protein